MAKKDKFVPQWYEETFNMNLAFEIQMGRSSQP